MWASRDTAMKASASSQPFRPPRANGSERILANVVLTTAAQAQANDISPAASRKDCVLVRQGSSANVAKP